MKTVALLIIIITAICAYMFFQLFMFDAPKPFSASEDYNPAGEAMIASQQNSMNLTAAENNLNAARLQITAAYENSRQAESDALIAQSEAQNKILLATNEAAVATAEKQYVIELTTDYTINLTINANIAVSNLNGTTTSQAHVVNIQSTTVANNVTMDAQQIASRATLSAITVQETRTALQIQNEISAASRQAQLDEIEFQNQINAQRDQRLADIKSAETKQMMLFFGTGLLTVIVIFGGVYFIIDLRMKKQVHNVGGHVIYSNQLMLAPPTEPHQITTNHENNRLLIPQQSSDNVDFSFLQQSNETAIEYLRNHNVILLNGAQGTGKTEFALHLAADRKNAIVIDPKPRTDWPQPANQIVGRGYKWQDIYNALNGLVTEMETRYDKMQDRSFTPDDLWIIVDEWPALSANIATASSVLKRIIFEGREAGLRVILITQSSDVKTLGIEGQGALREAFTFANLKKDIAGTRTIEVTCGDETKIFPHPGIYIPTSTPIVTPAPQLEPNLEWIDAVSETHGLNSAERAEQKAELELLEKIKANKDGTRSRRQLTELIYGKGKNDGSYSRRVKEVMEKYHVTTPPEWA